MAACQLQLAIAAAYLGRDEKKARLEAQVWPEAGTEIGEIRALGMQRAPTYPRAKPITVFAPVNYTELS